VVRAVTGRDRRGKMNMHDVTSQINLLAVVVAGICHMAVGLVWFQSALFGSTWAVLTKQELKPAARWVVPGFFGHILIALALAAIIIMASATTIVESLLVGVFVWLCFVVTLEIGELIWEKIPVKLFMIRIGNHLVALSVASLVLAIWK
jgi:hypothetical protein